MQLRAQLTRNYSGDREAEKPAELRTLESAIARERPLARPASPQAVALPDPAMEVRRRRVLELLGEEAGRADPVSILKRDSCLTPVYPALKAVHLPFVRHAEVGARTGIGIPLGLAPTK